jgi:hypothetical protein
VEIVSGWSSQSHSVIPPSLREMASAPSLSLGLQSLIELENDTVRVKEETG